MSLSFFPFVKGGRASERFTHVVSGTQLSSNPAPDSMAYNTLSRIVLSSLKGGSLRRFIHVLADGSRSSSPPLCMQKAGYNSLK